MTFGSVCSGIEGASVAWSPLGWRCAWTAEIEPFPAAVIQERWGHKNFGDFTKIGSDAEPIDLLVGGTPCQSFSVAGLRGGLADDRGNLALEFLRLADRTRPRWVVWENVPGVLSSNGGRDFGSILGGLGELGYGWAYRVLDAQHFGVPQRRRRVFVVGHLGDWRAAAAVLFERHSLQGHPPPRRKEGERVTPSVAARLGDGGYGHDFDTNGGLVSALTASGRGVERVGESRGQDPVVLARCVSAGEGKRQDWETCTMVTHSLRADGFDASEDGTGRGTPLVTIGLDQEFNASEDQLGTLKVGGHGGFCPPTVASPLLSGSSRAAGHNARSGHCKDAHIVPVSVCMGSDPISAEDLAMPQTTRNGDPGTISHGMAVRRLTPQECERLQGFPDDYTLIKFCGKPASDGPRYKALGNSWAVPVVRWIGQRIAEVQAATADLPPESPKTEPAEAL